MTEAAARFSSTSTSGRTPAPALPKNLDPRTLTLDDAAQAVRSRLPEDYRAREAFAEGEHWQGADAWIGPMPVAGSDGYTIARDEIERAFTPQDVLGEIVDRHVGGVVGHEPQWALVPRRFMAADQEPTAEEQTAIAEAGALLTAWWDRRKVAAMLQRVVARILWAGRGPVRLYVPKGLLVTETRDGQTVTGVRAASVEEALAQIWPDDPLPEQATVLEDPDTKRALGIFVAAEDLSRAQPGVAFLTYLAGAQTVLRTVTRDAVARTDAPAGSAPADQAPLPPGANAYDFGERLTMAEGCRKAFISSVLLQQQRALNLALSMLPRNLVTSNFLERIFLGVQPPGTWEKDAAGEPVFKPLPYRAGAGAAAFFQPTSTEGADGKPTFASPSIHEREASSPSPSIEAVAALYATMLSSAHQRHILLAAAGNTSGPSQQQARADYKRSLTLTATAVTELVQWLLETALAMAEAFAGTPQKYTKLVRVVVTPVLDLGPVSADERRQLDESVKAGNLSRESAMERAGVVDVDAEQARIAAQPDAQLETLKRQAEVMEILTRANLSVDLAAELVGMDPEQVKKIRTEVREPVTQ